MLLEYLRYPVLPGVLGVLVLLMALESNDTLLTQKIFFLS